MTLRTRQSSLAYRIRWHEKCHNNNMKLNGENKTNKYTHKQQTQNKYYIELNTIKLNMGCLVQWRFAYAHVRWGLFIPLTLLSLPLSHPTTVTVTVTVAVTVTDLWSVLGDCELVHLTWYCIEPHTQSTKSVHREALDDRSTQPQSHRATHTQPCTVIYIDT